MLPSQRRRLLWPAKILEGLPWKRAGPLKFAGVVQAQVFCITLYGGKANRHVPLGPRAWGLTSVNQRRATCWGNRFIRPNTGPTVKSIVKISFWSCHIGGWSRKMCFIVTSQNLWLYLLFQPWSDSLKFFRPTNCLKTGKMTKKKWMKKVKEKESKETEENTKKNTLFCSFLFLPYFLLFLPSLLLIFPFFFLFSTFRFLMCSHLAYHVRGAVKPGLKRKYRNISPTFFVNIFKWGYCLGNFLFCRVQGVIISLFDMRHRGVHHHDAGHQAVKEPSNGWILHAHPQG